MTLIKIIATSTCGILESSHFLINESSFILHLIYNNFACQIEDTAWACRSTYRCKKSEALLTAQVSGSRLYAEQAVIL